MSGADNRGCRISDFGEFLSSVTMECQFDLGLGVDGAAKKEVNWGELPWGPSRWREKHRDDVEAGKYELEFSSS